MKFDKTKFHTIPATQIINSHSIVTLTAPSGKHFTYKFLQRETKNPDDKVYFLYSLTNGKDWVYLGALVNESFKPPKIPTFAQDDERVNGLMYLLQCALGKRKEHPDMILQHMGRCLVCGKALTDSVSIQYGIGPTCRRRVG